MLENLPYRLLRHHTLDINKSAIEETRETVQLAFRVVGDALKGEAGEHRSVYSFGPRLALCFDVCEAIRALGIALSEVSSFFLLNTLVVTKSNPLSVVLSLGTTATRGKLDPVSASRGTATDS